MIKMIEMIFKFLLKNEIKLFKSGLTPIKTAIMKLQVKVVIIDSNILLINRITTLNKSMVNLNA